jgi:alpha-beta hydrolase superfamily lysophospholipase
MRTRWLVGTLVLLLSGWVTTANAASELPRRAALGAQLAESPQGVRIQAVLPGGTAQTVGLAAGDLLLGIDRRDIRALADVFAWTAQSQAGAEVRIEVQRGDGKETLALRGTAIARPMEQAGPGYRVEYGVVEGAKGARLRTITSVPEDDQGPHPALMLIQGVTLSSIDQPLTDGNPYSRLLAPFARAGYVTLRVDKPGTGDSEGGPASALDFDTELAGYRAALAALKERDDVDPERVFLIGHSMGGVWAPLLAAELEVAGIAAYGTVFRTWNEYDLENARRQFRLGGEGADQIHTALIERAQLNAALLLDRLSPEDAAKARPALAGVIGGQIVDGSWNGRAVPFWQQLAIINIAEVWRQAQTPVLALHGEADFVAARIDHELLVEAVRAAGVDAEFHSVPASDHGFLATASEAAAFAAFGKPGGIYSSAAARKIDRWLVARGGRAAFTAEDRTLEALPRGTGPGRTMDASLGDLDGDGDLDLVLAKEFAGNTWLRQHDGRFEWVVDGFPASAEDSEDAVLADFDGDGDLDAVFPSEDTAINEYFLNDGHGRFSAAPHVLPGSTISNAGVAGDLDRDGDIDLVLSRNRAPELVLLNDGRGRFIEATEQWMPPVIDVTQDLVLADLDADGDLDLVAGNEPTDGGRNRLYRNTGERFEDVTDAMLPAAAGREETRKVALGDVDGDGDPDLYFANVDFGDPAAARPRLLLNDGRGVFSEAAGRHPLGYAGSVLDAGFSDVDGDADLDLLLGTLGRDGTRLLINDGAVAGFVDRTPAGWASGEPLMLGIVALRLPADLGVFESGFDRGDRVLMPQPERP